MYLAAGPVVLGFVDAKVVTAAMKASGVYAPWSAENDDVTAHLDAPESHPNNSPTFCVACCTTIPPSPVAFEPEANSTNLSATCKLEVFWKDAVPNTVKLLLIITFGWIVKSPDVVLIVLSFVTPTVIFPKVAPANDGLSVTCNPKSIADCWTPFVTR